tara:strand:+ start:271 stop:462 length:192 start_codon:yes stop_codon:yes gene_type:complete
MQNNFPIGPNLKPDQGVSGRSSAAARESVPVNTNTVQNNSSIRQLHEQALCGKAGLGTYFLIR